MEGGRTYICGSQVPFTLYAELDGYSGQRHLRFAEPFGLCVCGVVERCHPVPRKINGTRFGSLEF